MTDDWEQGLQALEDWTDGLAALVADGDLLSLATAATPAPLLPDRPPVEHAARARRAQEALTRLQDALTQQRDAVGRELSLHRRLPPTAPACRSAYVDGYG